MRFCRAAWRDGEAVPERGLGLMWYAIQVETGREDAACEDVRQAAGDLIEECFVPKYRAGARLPDGSWGARDERLLPGYLVCDTRRVDDVAARLRRRGASRACWAAGTRSFR